jgi:hypothetical protein
MDIKLDGLIDGEGCAFMSLAEERGEERRGDEEDCRFLPLYAWDSAACLLSFFLSFFLSFLRSLSPLHGQVVDGSETKKGVR